MSQVTSIPRVNDLHLIDCFIDDLYEDFFYKSCPDNKVDLFVGEKLYQITRYNFDDKKKCKHPIVIELKKNRSESISKITCDFGQSYKITYIRSDNSFVDQLHLEQVIEDKYNIGMTDEICLFFLKLHKNLLKNANPELRFDNFSNLFSNHHSLISQLESLNTNLIEKQYAQVNELINDKRSYEAELEKQFSEKRTELESEYQKLKVEQESKQQKILKIVEEKEKKIIDLDNTTARRQTTKDVLDSVKTKAEIFNFSLSVNKNYGMVWILSLALLAFSVGSAIFSYVAMLKTDLTAANFTVEQWLILARIFIFTLLAISSAIYLIRWFNAQGNRLANIELDYQKFSRDLSRADLTIEMCLEWNDKKDGQIPEELIRAMTKGLFDETEKRKNLEDIQHPAEQLASALIKSAEKIEFPLGTSQITTKGNNLTK